MFSTPIKNPVALPPRRRRLAVSCEACRQRKLKCNRQEPCSHCIQSNATCTYSRLSQSVKRPVAPSYTASFVSTPQGAKTAFTHSSNSAQLPDPTHPSPPAPSPNLEHRSRSPNLRPNTNIEIGDLEARVRALEHIIAVQFPNASVGDVQDTNSPQVSNARSSWIPPQNESLNLNKFRLFGRSHWTQFVHEFEKIAMFLAAEPNNSTEDAAMRYVKSEVDTLRKQTKMLAKRTKSSRPTRCVSLPEPNIISPSKDLADSLVRLYTTHFESSFRILHIPSFWSEYNRYREDPSGASSAIRFKVQLVLAIGSSLVIEPTETAKILPSARQWIYSAQDWLAGPMEKNRLSISVLQVQCLLFIARQVLSVGADLIWIGMGSVIRTAMQLGLHRDPRHFTRMTIFEAELGRRLWATILELNLQASLDSGTPPGVSYDDFDTEAPSNVNDEDIEIRTDVLVQYPDSTTTDTSLQRLMFKTLRPRLEILRALNSSAPELVHDKVLALHSEIAGACSQCRSQIPHSVESPIRVFRYNMADLLLRRFILSLHRQFVSRAYTGPLRAFSRRMCLDAATALLSPIQNEEFSHLILIAGGLFKCRIIHASLVIASELLVEMEECTQGSTTIKNLLIIAIREACSQLEGRMRLGETNTRLHVKLSVVRCQAECLASGTAALQLQVAQSAKDSLEGSYSRLKLASGLSTEALDSNDAISPFQDVRPTDFNVDFNFEDIFGTANFTTEGMCESNSFF